MGKHTSLLEILVNTVVKYHFGVFIKFQQCCSLFCCIIDKRKKFYNIGFPEQEETIFNKIKTPF